MDRYVLEKKVGEGGMAEVFRARRVGAAGFTSRCAVKRLLPDLARDAALQARFVDEARIAGRLQHANIVRTTDFYEEDGRQHLVMEFVDGASVEHLVQRGIAGRFLPPEIAARIVVDVTRAVAHAHAEDVLHRDVSACNVLVSRDGAVKLVDFGLADARERVSSTDPGGLAGKLEYLSPERRRGEEATTHDDLFAVGVLLERLLEAMDPRERAQAVGQRLGAIRARLVVPKEQRIPSATALLAELRGTPAADAETTADFVQRNPQPHAAPTPLGAPRFTAADLDETTASGGDADDETTEDGAPATDARAVGVTIPDAHPLAHLTEDDDTHVDPPRAARTGPTSTRATWLMLGALALAALVFGAWLALGPTRAHKPSAVTTAGP